jgi:hypothetical protein
MAPGDPFVDGSCGNLITNSIIVHLFEISYLREQFSVSATKFE